MASANNTRDFGGLWRSDRLSSAQKMRSLLKVRKDSEYRMGEAQRPFAG
jgi:hypothetical protein